MGRASAVSDRRRILLVDDIELSRVLTEAVLRSAPYEVRSVHDGAAALAALEGETYDLVLMDLEMPGLSGHDTAAEIRRRETETPAKGKMRLAAISAQSGPTIRRRSIEVGMIPHIERPIAPHELLRQIEAVFCSPATDAEADPWERRCYDDWACRLGNERVDGFLVALRDQLHALVALLADDACRNKADRLAHDVASTSGTLGFHEVTRCCRALADASNRDREAARRALVVALECATARLDGHLAKVERAAAAA